MLKGNRNRLGHDRNTHGLNRKKVQRLQTEDEEDVSALSSSSKHSSPVPSPLQHTALVEKNSVKDKTLNVHGYENLLLSKDGQSN